VRFRLSWKQYCFIHRVLKQRSHYICCKFAKCWSIFQILLPTDLSVNFCQGNDKICQPSSNMWPHYLVKHLCSKVAMLRSWVERTDTQPLVTVTEKYSSSDVSTVFSPTKNPKNRHSPTVRTCSNQEERSCDEMRSAHTINVQTVADDISRRVTSGRQNTSLIAYLSIMGLKLLRAIIVTWCCVL